MIELVSLFVGISLRLAAGFAVFRVMAIRGCLRPPDSTKRLAARFLGRRSRGAEAATPQ